ncbi:MAG: hypothetical protein KJ574_02135, partial [Nanoarchaeota archaeon]|nr:hypothetical protein [Nanoarchaeota archaeon]
MSEKKEDGREQIEIGGPLNQRIVVDEDGIKRVVAELPEHLTPRELRIIEECVLGRRQSNLETLLEQLRMERGDAALEEWRAQTRIAQAEAVVAKFPDSLPAYFAYDFKGSSSRIDEGKAITSLLQNSKVTQYPYFFRFMIASDSKQTAPQKRVLNEFLQFTELLRKINWLRQLRDDPELRAKKFIELQKRREGTPHWMTTRTYNRKMKEGGYAKAITNCPDFEELKKFYAMLDATTNNALAKLKKRPASRRFVDTIDGLLEIGLEKLISSRDPEEAPTLLMFNRI